MNKISRIKFDVILDEIVSELPKYRIYVDNDLLVERTFVWEWNKNFIQENLIINVESGIHTLKIEKIPNYVKILVQNCFVDENPFIINETLEQTFTVL